AQALACVISPSRCGSGGTNLFPETNPNNAEVTVINPVACPNTNVLRCTASTWPPSLKRRKVAGPASMWPEQRKQ
ncbi:MAG: hypothetical protein ACK55Z_32370, partial [bacterium]